MPVKHIEEPHDFYSIEDDKSAAAGWKAAINEEIRRLRKAHHYFTLTPFILIRQHGKNRKLATADVAAIRRIEQQYVKDALEEWNELLLEVDLRLRDSSLHLLHEQDYELRQSHLDREEEIRRKIAEAWQRGHKAGRVELLLNRVAEAFVRWLL